MSRRTDPTRLARSYERFQADDFAYLAAVAHADLDAFTKRHPRHHTLKSRLLCILLCQGAALHVWDTRNGVKDFDVWMFFRDDAVSPIYPYRTRHEYRYERPTFRDSSRWIDVLGRTIPAFGEVDPIRPVQRYLAFDTTSTSRQLRKKAAVILEPASRLGEIVWWPIGTPEAEQLQSRLKR